MCKLCQQQCAKFSGTENPIASQLEMDNFYVDIMLVPLHTTEKAPEIINEKNHCEWRLYFTKWFSKFEEMFENIANRPIKLEDSLVLGLEWIAGDNLLTVRKDQEFLQKTNWTQGSDSFVQKFNPLGFMAPFVIRERMLMK